MSESSDARAADTPEDGSVPATWIRGGTVLLPTSVGAVSLAAVATDLYLVEEKIAGIGEAPNGFDRSTARVVDARGLWVVPGLVDLCARTGSRAVDRRRAAAAGIAAFVSVSEGRIVSVPGAGDATLADRTADAARFAFGVEHGGALAAASASDIGRLHEAMRQARDAGVALWLRPQDRQMAADGVMASGVFAARLGLTGVPVAAETAAIGAIVAAMRESGAAVHLSCLSSAEGVALVQQAKAAGLPLTCDVSIHHLHLVDVDIGWFDTRFRFDPPLRGAADRAALRQAVRDGTIDAIGSAHTDHRARAKQVPFARAPAGAPAWPLLLALTLKWAMEDRVPPGQALARLTSAPAAIAGVHAGRIAPGAVANLVLFDPDDDWQVPPAPNLSFDTGADPAAASPFAGFELPAPVRRVFVAGREIDTVLPQGD